MSGYHHHRHHRRKALKNLKWLISVLLCTAFIACCVISVPARVVCLTLALLAGIIVIAIKSPKMIIPAILILLIGGFATYSIGINGASSQLVGIGSEPMIGGNPLKEYGITDNELFYWATLYTRFALITLLIWILLIWKKLIPNR